MSFDTTLEEFPDMATCRPTDDVLTVREEFAMRFMAAMITKLDPNPSDFDLRDCATKSVRGADFLITALNANKSMD